MQLSEEQLQLLNTLIALIVGAMSSMAIEFVKKRKSKSQQSIDYAEAMNRTASDNVQSAQVIINILRELLEEEKEKNDEIVKQFQKEILETHEKYASTISDLEAHNIFLQREKESLSSENAKLNHAIANITQERERESYEFKNLVARLIEKLSVYEVGMDIEAKKREGQSQDLKLDDLENNTIE